MLWMLLKHIVEGVLFNKSIVLAEFSINALVSLIYRLHVLSSLMWASHDLATALQSFSLDNISVDSLHEPMPKFLSIINA